jgi:rSAM/selenodomain-associated transferase 1
MSNQRTLIIFTRYPEIGKTKTRLIPLLGAKGAADFQRKMTEETIKKAKLLCTKISVELEVHFTGGNEELMCEWLGKDLIFKKQVKGDLGLKMYTAFKESFNKKEGQKRVIIIGIDCPDLDELILEKAFNVEPIYDLIIGPANDGGYYLIGLNRVISQLFNNIKWGTSEVLQSTETIANQLSLKTYNLPLLNDIDTPEDFHLLNK